MFEIASRKIYFNFENVEALTSSSGIYAFSHLDVTSFKWKCGSSHIYPWYVPVRKVPSRMENCQITMKNKWNETKERRRKIYH